MREQCHLALAWCPLPVVLLKFGPKAARAAPRQRAPPSSRLNARRLGTSSRFGRLGRRPLRGVLCAKPAWPMVASHASSSFDRRLHFGRRRDLLLLHLLLHLLRGRWPVESRPRCAEAGLDGKALGDWWAFGEKRYGVAKGYCRGGRLGRTVSDLRRRGDRR